MILIQCYYLVSILPHNFKPFARRNKIHIKIARIKINKKLKARKEYFLKALCLSVSVSCLWSKRCERNGVLVGTLAYHSGGPKFDSPPRPGCTSFLLSFSFCFRTPYIAPSRRLHSSILQTIHSSCLYYNKIITIILLWSSEDYFHPSLMFQGLSGQP